MLHLLAPLRQGDNCASVSGLSRGDPRSFPPPRLRLSPLRCPARQPAVPRISAVRRRSLTQAPAKLDIALEMMVFITQLMVDHDETLGVMGQRQLPRHADAAVH